MCVYYHSKRIFHFVRMFCLRVYSCIVCIITRSEQMRFVWSPPCLMRRAVCGRIRPCRPAKKLRIGRIRRTGGRPLLGSCEDFRPCGVAAKRRTWRTPLTRVSTVCSKTTTSCWSKPPPNVPKLISPSTKGRLRRCSGAGPTEIWPGFRPAAPVRLAGLRNRKVSPST